jgi:hypothetical protein
MTRTVVAVLPPIPIGRGPRGRLVGAQRRKRLAVVAGLWCIAIAPTVLDLPLRWKALGAGLIFPGAGELYRGHVWLFVAVLALTAVALYRMWVMADHLALPAIYLGAAVVAALLPGDISWPWVAWVVPCAAVAALAIGEALQWISYLRARQVGRRRNAYLQGHFTQTDFAVRTSSRPRVVESTIDELCLQRWVLDHALQPLDDWDVYDWSEKSQRDPRSVRYQLNWLQWALAIGQYTRTPSFSGYVAEGQRRLIERMRDRRIWGYWRAESIAGNFDFSADPVRKDNIMFSGYLELMVGIYAVLNSDRRYDVPGALTFAWDRDHRFVYDHAGLSDAVENNFRTSRFGLFACEPTFVFPICNILGLLGLAYRDVLDNGERAARLLPRFARSLEHEFTAADGDLHLALCDRYGLRAVPVRGTELTGQHGFYLRPLMPGVSERMWTICRRELVETHAFAPRQARGRSIFLGDWGSRKASSAALYASLASQSREFGDDDVHREVIDTAREVLGWRVERGVGCYERASRVANAQLAVAQLNRCDGWLQMLRSPRPHAWDHGPRLADVAYPDVLVAKAVADHDRLDLVLYPGGEPGRRFLHLDRLQPGARYRADGAVSAGVTADATGRATVAVDLDKRFELTVRRG